MCWQVAAVFAYIESTEGFHPTESTESTDASSRTLECFMAFVRNFMPCFYDAESTSGGTEKMFYVYNMFLLVSCSEAGGLVLCDSHTIETECL